MTDDQQARRDDERTADAPDDGDSAHADSSGQRRSGGRHATGSNRSWRLLEWPIIIAVAIGAAILIRAFVWQSFWIPSGSMEDTLKVGDRVIVNKLAYKIHSIDRGDVIVFHKPKTWNIKEEDLIKRVVAVGGDTVRSDAGGTVWVNGKKADQSHAKLLRPCPEPLAFAQRAIPKGEVWVMGDNRCDSDDSRFQGPVPTGDVVGHAFVLIWPVSRWDWL